MSKYLITSNKIVVLKDCQGCGEEFLVKKCTLGKYCSIKCYGKSMIGKDNHQKGLKRSISSRQKMSDAKKDFVPWNKGVEMSDEYKSNWLKSMVGKNKRDKNPNWRGGVSDINNLIRTSDKYKEWRMSIFKRDQWTCQFCGSKGVVLNVDHIKPFFIVRDENNIKSLEDAFACDALWELDNGRTLCFDCHYSLPTSIKRDRDEFGKFTDFSTPSL